MAKKKKKLWLKIGLPILVVVVVGILVAVNLQKSRANITEITVEKAKTGRLVETVSGTGRMQPEIQVKISANVSGRILELNAKEGDWVKKGDLLVRLDRARYEAAVDQAASSEKSAVAGLAKSRSELTRIKELSQRGMASQADLEAAQAQFELQSAQLEQAQAYLKQAHDDLSKTSIYTPMDGIVSQVNKEVGEMAIGAQFSEDVILVVADLTKMEVLVEIDENDIVNVALKDTARVKIDAYPDTTFKAEVREIAHTATTRGLGTPEELTNFQVKVAMLEVPPKLRPGMSATADIFT
jgi:HlyD family secretion protein